MKRVLVQTTTLPNVRHRKRRRREHPLAVIFGLAWLVVVIAPLWYLLTTSLRSQSSYLSSDPWIPTGLTLSNYNSVLATGFLGFMLNSLIVAGISIAIVCSTALLASYAIARYRTPLASLTLFVSLACLAIPAVSVIIPLYVISEHLHLYNTLWGVALPLSAFGIPVAVLICSTFLRDVPGELFDSMSVDGAGMWTVFHRLAAPMSRPALAIVAVYQCIQSWNNLLFPLILTQSPSKRVLPLVMFDFQGQFSMNVPGVLAAVLLSSVPLLVMYTIARRQIVGGIAAGYGR